MLNVTRVNLSMFTKNLSTISRAYRVEPSNAAGCHTCNTWINKTL